MNLNNNHKSILFHLGRGAELTLKSNAAFVYYHSEERYIAVNHVAAEELAAAKLIQEVSFGKFISLKSTSVGA